MYINNLLESQLQKTEISVDSTLNLRIHEKYKYFNVELYSNHFNLIG